MCIIIVQLYDVDVLHLAWHKLHDAAMSRSEGILALILGKHCVLLFGRLSLGGRGAVQLYPAG